MKKQLHKNYRIAALLLIAILILKIILQLLPQTVIVAGGMPYVIASYLILVIVIVLVWKGFSWMRYVLIILIVFALYLSLALIRELKYPTISVFIELAQVILLLTAQVILLQIPSKD